LTLSLRLSRSFQLPGGSRIEGLVEAFNLTNHVNAITRNTTFGPGSYPSNPVLSFNTVTAVGDPRTVQVDGARLESGALEPCRDVPKHLFRSHFNDLAPERCLSVFPRK